MTLSNPIGFLVSFAIQGIYSGMMAKNFNALGGRANIPTQE